MIWVFNVEKDWSFYPWYLASQLSGRPFFPSKHVTAYMMSPGGPIKLQNESDRRVSTSLSNPSFQIIRPTKRSHTSTWGHSSAAKLRTLNSFIIPSSCDNDGSNTSPKIAIWDSAPSCDAATRTITRWTVANANIAVMGSITVFVREERGAAIMSSQRNWGAKVSKETPASMISLAARLSLVKLERLRDVEDIMFEVIMGDTELSIELMISAGGDDRWYDWRILCTGLWTMRLCVSWIRIDKTQHESTSTWTNERTPIVMMHWCLNEFRCSVPRRKVNMLQAHFERLFPFIIVVPIIIYFK